LRSAPRRLLIAILFLVAASACGGGSTKETPAGQDISIDVPVAPGSAQTIRLAAVVRGRGTVGVVLAHMLGSQQLAWAPLIPGLLDDDFHVLTFDFRGHGLSGGSRDPSRADLDLAGAVQRLRQLGATKIFVVGASMGGTAAIRVVAAQKLAGVVAISAPDKIGKLDASPTAVLLRQPSLFIVARGDDKRYTGAAQKLFQGAMEPKSLRIIDGTSAHGTDLLLGSSGARIMKLILDFLVSHRG
jgi:pimeloyl-ACP methyl ester carboxylesterase